MNREVDICLVVEGTYPYVVGGVANWTHELIQRQSHLTFHVVCILPKDFVPELKFQIPANVLGITNIFLHDSPAGKELSRSAADDLMAQLHDPLAQIIKGAGIQPYRQLLEVFKRNPGIGFGSVMNSRSAWELIKEMYEEEYPEASMIDYFWSWRAMVGGLLSLMLADIPPARSYHTLCTGYAGLYAARAKLETGRPLVLTEHGIYTNERRIEIASADWLEETTSKALTIDSTRRNLRDFWADSFSSFSRICYEAADKIITQFEGNQIPQLEDGATVEKLQIIPNGIDTERFGAIPLDAHERPTVALIARVVPIKDVKTYLRAMANLHESVPDLRALVIGGADEDPDYFRECKQMVEGLGLDKVVEFTGQVDVTQYLNVIDVVVLSSISEAQPLVLLEAGSVGIPLIATDVGSCSELILGRKSESPRLGAGGAIIPLANPGALADAALQLLTDYDFYQSCSKAIKARMIKCYNKDEQYNAYKALYDGVLKAA